MKNNKVFNRNLELGCGLIRIGRVWGVNNQQVPSDSEAQNFLEQAYELGIRFFDTAPSYGLSEKRLGVFLDNLTKEQRKTVFVSTKFGEHWNFDSQEPYVDHSYEALQVSLEKSLKRLGSINLIQLHKASKQLLQNSDVNKALIEAQALKITFLGVSVSDIQTGVIACDDDRFTHIQLPYNIEKPELLPIIENAVVCNKIILFNRPIAMGSLISNKSDKEKQAAIQAAYSYIFQTKAAGVVLTGTATVQHLQENIKIFNEVSLNG